MEELSENRLRYYGVMNEKTRIKKAVELAASSCFTDTTHFLDMEDELGLGQRIKAKGSDEKQL